MKMVLRSAGQAWAYTHTSLLVTSFVIHALAGLAAVALMVPAIGRLLF